MSEFKNLLGKALAAKDPRKTPAPPKDRIRGSDKNKPKSASTSNPKIEVSESTKSALEAKLKAHNAKYKTKATMGMLLAVFRRGAGAYSTSHAPGMTRNGWGYKRVDAFLYLLANGKPKNPNYVQDNDLLPKK